MEYTKNQLKEIANARKRAISQAWKQERTYIKNGVGTRDWTPEQQEELLNRGTISRYEGHHMRSVSNGTTYDEQMKIAGDKNNIQFLEKSKENNEHLRAHGGNTQTRTNGFYDVNSGKMHDFGKNPPQPPEAKSLTNPIVNQNNTENTGKALSSASNNNISSKNVASKSGGGARAPNDNIRCNTDNLPTETTPSQGRGAKPSQEDNPPSNKGISSERGQKPSSTESERKNNGVERGQKPSESENKSQGNNSTSRGERPQEAPQNTSNGITQRGTPPGSTGGEDSKPSAYSSNNHSDSRSAGSTPSKASDETSKAASEQATQTAIHKETGMGM